MAAWVLWNLWHGCHKLSPGCANCYVYRGDAKHGLDASKVEKTSMFSKPTERLKRSGEYKVKAGSIVATCFSSDFFVPEADEWRPEAWAMMRERSDCRFFFITKRIDRFHVGLPDDWGEGYPNVSIGCTMENQAMADLRLPLFKAAPVSRRTVICEPLLGPVTLDLDNSVAQVVAGGESGPLARPCDYEWVLSLRYQAAAAGCAFWFKQTGARFIREGRLYHIPRNLQHVQARKAGINSEVKMY